MCKYSERLCSRNKEVVSKYRLSISLPISGISSSKCFGVRIAQGIWVCEQDSQDLENLQHFDGFIKVSSLPRRLKFNDILTVTADPNCPPVTGV